MKLVTKNLDSYLSFINQKKNLIVINFLWFQSTLIIHELSREAAFLAVHEPRFSREIEKLSNFTGQNFF